MKKRNRIYVSSRFKARDGFDCSRPGETSFSIFSVINGAVYAYPKSKISRKRFSNVISLKYFRITRPLP